MKYSFELCCPRVRWRERAAYVERTCVSEEKDERRIEAGNTEGYVLPPRPLLRRG
jgi:hypothetical protein